MHFSIPDTQEFINEATGSHFTGYNIHLNGNFHCCLRYKQLHSLHEQLKRSLSTLAFPAFPSKKFLPLTPNQLEQRRVCLERYIQLIGQDPTFSKSELLRLFLLNAQQESSGTESREISLEVYLMNGFCIQVNCYTTECTYKVLEKVCANIDLLKEYTYFFGLYLMRKENDGNVTLLKKLMDFESPYISQRLLTDCKIVLRKCYWDPIYDQQLMKDSIALNLLYIQTVCDVEKDWIITTPNIREQLLNLKSRSNKKEYLDIAKKLPSYGCIQFSNTIVDYPEPNMLATIVIGNKELCIRTNLNSKIQETKFKVTRMRCWRTMTNFNNEENLSNSSSDSQIYNIELSFEYLMSKNCLKWITITSDQSMLMSICLQNMVDELLNQKDGNDLNCFQMTRSNHTPTLSYIRRDGKNRRLSESSSTDTISSLNDVDVPLQNYNESRFHKLKDKISTTVFFQIGKDSVQNKAFEGIGDDDL